MNAAPLLPVLTPSLDPRSLPIGPREAFVLSQVDGVSTLVDIALATGLSEEEVSHILRALEQLGAIHFEASSQSSSTRMRVLSERSSSHSIEEGAPTEKSPALHAGFTPHPQTENGDSEASEGELDEAVDLTPSIRLEIQKLHQELEQRDYYELLGVDRSADRKAIKAAYFDKVSLFHTDRYFGKELGSYKARIERIFAELTKAHDTLTKSSTRAQYDEYLQSRQLTLGVRDTLPPPPTIASSAVRIPAAAPSQWSRESSPLRSPLAPSETPTFLHAEEQENEDLRPLDIIPTSPAPDWNFVPPPSSTANRASTTSGSVSPASQRSTQAPPPLTPRSLDPQTAKKLLAKKLGARSSNSLAPPRSLHPPGATLPPTSSEQNKQMVQERMRAQVEARLQSEQQQAQHYVEMASQAVQQGEWGSALNHLRIALSLAPQNAEVQKLFASTQLQANQALCGQFFEQGKFEEADGHFERAARSFEKAALGRQAKQQSLEAALLFQRAAHCLLECQGDPKKTVELARRALALEPQQAKFYITLARAYEMADMRTSAQGALKRALELEPQNPEAKALQRILK